MTTTPKTLGENIFTIGDVVQLRSGGTPMTIETLKPDSPESGSSEGSAVCVYFLPDGKLAARSQWRTEMLDNLTAEQEMFGEGCPFGPMTDEQAKKEEMPTSLPTSGPIMRDGTAADPEKFGEITFDLSIEQEIQAKGLTAPRVTPDDLVANIVDTEIVKHVSRSGQVLRWAILTTRNGFAVAGKPSCAASNENDDAELGEKLAISNATDELWPLMGYTLKERLYQATQPAQSPE